MQNYIKMCTAEYIKKIKCDLVKKVLEDNKRLKSAKRKLCVEKRVFLL